MILKNKTSLIQLGVYPKGRILFYDKQKKSLLAINETAMDKDMSQLRLANFYVIAYAILAYISSFFTLHHMLFKAILLVVCQCLMFYYARKIAKIQVGDGILYDIDPIEFEMSDFKKWFQKMKRLFFALVLGGAAVYILSATLFLMFGDIRLLILFACASFIESILMCSHMIETITLKFEDIYKL